MKIFISWSGETTQRYAKILRDWLPTVLNVEVPWVSSEDIDKGKHWREELGAQLDESDFGIICVDPSNIKSPWLHFEAGALSQSVQAGRIFPLLFGVSKSDVSDPFSRYQTTSFEEEEVTKLLKGVSAASDPPVSDAELAKRVQYSWRSLQERIGELGVYSPPAEPTPRHVYSLDDKAGTQKYMDKWIRNGGRVVIWTRDMSWGAEPETRRLLREKAGKGELMVCLPKRIPLTDELEGEGAEIFAYGADTLSPASRFTVTFFGRPGARVAVGRPVKNDHVIDEFDSGEHPAYYIASDLVKLAQRINHGG